MDSSGKPLLCEDDLRSVALASILAAFCCKNVYFSVTFAAVQCLLYVKKYILLTYGFYRFCPVLFISRGT